MTLLLQNGNFSFIFSLFFFFCQDFIIFLPKKNRKKKDFAAARLATISATRYTGNKFFFKGGPIRVYVNISSHTTLYISQLCDAVYFIFADTDHAGPEIAVDSLVALRT